MLVVDSCSLEFILELSLVKILKSILEKTIILLQDSVLGAKLERVASAQGILHARSSERLDGCLGVEHTKVTSFAFEMVDLLRSSCRSIIRGVNEVHFSWLGHDSVLAQVLITVSVSTDDDGLGPAWDKSWNVRDDDWFPEDGTIQDVSNGSIWGLPHFAQPKLFNSILIWGDGGALNSHLAQGDGFCCINSDLIFSCISVFNAQIKVLGIKIKIWVNMLKEIEIESVNLLFP
jgi:hypothetical protein